VTTQTSPTTAPQRPTTPSPLTWVREGCIYNHRRRGQRGQWAWGKPQPSRFAFISSSGPVLAPIQRISQAIKICTITISEIIVVPYDINQSSITIVKIVIAILIDRITPGKFLSMISRLYRLFEWGILVRDASRLA
jgi:hypothetical protein